MLDRDGLDALCRARARLRAAGDEPVRIRRLAAEIGLSPHHFIRRFKAVFGDTPHQVAVRARLERAKELLLDSKESVTGISLRLGFASLGTFSARFAREVGMAPSRFRCLAVRSRPEALSCLGLMTGEPLPPESNFEEAPARAIRGH
jgi:AraC-like DNA-binding protein